MSLSASELAQIRADISALLPDTCEIQYPVRTLSNGKWTDTWTSRGSAIACRISPAMLVVRGNAEITAETLKEGQAWVITLPHNQTITVKDRIIAGGKTYQVRSISSGESEIGCVRVYAELLE